MGAPAHPVGCIRLLGCARFNAEGAPQLEAPPDQQDLMALVFQLCQLDVLPEAGCGIAIRFTLLLRS
jgi:hypothetical protein